MTDTPSRPAPQQACRHGVPHGRDCGSCDLWPDASQTPSDAQLEYWCREWHRDSSAPAAWAQCFIAGYRLAEKAAPQQEQAAPLDASPPKETK